MTKFITIIVQVTSRCNLHCKYCYVRYSGINACSISIDNIDQLIENCSKEFESVEFCWHGGEPLLMGKEFYENIIDKQKEITRIIGTKFRNTIQTNGTLLSDELINFFKKNKFGIGISFDAPEAVNNITRPFKNGESSTPYVLYSADRIVAADLKFQPLCVITNKNIKKASEIFDFFKNAKAKSYSLLIEMSTDNYKIPSNNEVFELYRDTFEMWLDDNNPFESIQPIETFVKGLIGGKPQMCSFSESCLNKMITIHPDGGVAQCGSFVENKYILGNIYKKSLLKILQGNKCLDLKKVREAAYINNCRECEYGSICKGGCREAAYVNTKNYSSAYPYCEARKLTFEYIRDRLVQITSKAKLE